MPIDWTSLGIAFGSLIGVPVGTWGVSSIVNLDKQFAAHEKVDDARFKQIHESQIRTEAMVIAMGEKLDHAIERLPARRER